MNGSEKEWTDEELVARFQAGDGTAADILVENYKQLVRIRARALYLAGGDREDLLQEGMIGLFNAMRTYRPDHENGASFRTYASVCVSRQMYSAVQSSARKKNLPLNESVSIEELEERQADEKLGTAQSPESILLGRESESTLLDGIRSVLSSYEKDVLDLYLEGMDYRQIAEKLGRPDKSVDNALQRIRGKVQNLLRSRSA
ncbi:MAG: sigma-70 family RNA polymerase sigma factor [Lachnospiraceae bacterium]|jgi:RNA polymerase sporulation-specific sigma factor|nr:sigma-70 family RNA polymerase sigma factor [Lachnospiraceae bacterium]MCI1327444.1 sigma-70 family RNA polymerase sigma factor [Lachnospiraceae bacterium]